MTEMASAPCARCGIPHLPADQRIHGPETCDGCNVYHFGWWYYMDEYGCPLRPDIEAPVSREVVFAGFDNDGRPLYTDPPATA